MNAEDLAGWRKRSKEIRQIEHQLADMRAHPEAMQDPRSERLYEYYIGTVGQFRAEALRLEERLTALEPVERAVIRAYYLDGCCPTWQQVADTVRFSLVQVHRFRRSAIKKLEEMDRT